MIYTRLLALTLALSTLYGSAQTIVEEVVIENDPIVIVKQDPESEMMRSVINNTKLVSIGTESSAADSDNNQQLINQFYEDQFRHFQDPRAPYFMLMSRNGKLAMGIGGSLKMQGAYDWDGSIDGLGFAPYDIPIPADPAAMQLMQLTANHSTVFMSVFGKSDRFGAFQIYIQGKFNGPSNSFKLSKAYATLGDWTVGLNKSTFDDPTAQPATVETSGPNSEVDDSRMLIRYMHAATKHFSFALSAEAPSFGIASSNYYKPISVRVPDIAAFLQLSSGKSHVRLSGIIKNMGYRDLVNGSNHNVTGWGVNLSTKIHPTGPVTIYGAVNTGKGISNFVEDLGGSNTDLLGYASDLGKMYAPQSYGWYAALQYYFSPKVFSTVIASQERLITKSDTQYAGSGYKYGLYGTANVFYYVTPRVLLGAEFNLGKRVNIDGDHRMARRISLSAEFSF